MQYQEYMNTLMEQIGNKRARQLVAEEMENHIEEQCEAYEMDGMNHEEALKEAVRQMGDPMETGSRLNQIHKPKLPVGILVTAFLLTVVGIVMQSIIFSQVENAEVTSSYFMRTLVYNGIGFGIIFLFLFLDYTYIGRYAYQIYGAYLLLTGAGGLLINPSVQQMVIGYYSMILFPLVLAGLIYKNRNRGMKGEIVCMICSFMAMLWNHMCFFGGLSGKIETSFAILILFVLAVRRNIFGTNQKVQTAVLCVPVFLMAGIIGFGVFVPNTIFKAYQMMRIRAFLHPGQYADTLNYMASLQQKAASNYTLWGNRVLPYDAHTMMYSDYVLSSIFSWFGIIVGTLVILGFLIFLVKSFQISLKQSNRIGLLVGSACSATLLIRIIGFVAVNFGFNVYSTSSVPFLSYGLANAVCSSVFVGCIASVFRNTSILSEQNSLGKGKTLRKFIV